MTTCQEIGHCVNPDDTTNTCQRCGVTVGKPFWPDRALPQTDKTISLQELVVVPKIECLGASLKDLESNVCGSGAISDYSDNSLEIVMKAARAYLSLTEQQEKE